MQPQCGGVQTVAYLIILPVYHEMPLHPVYYNFGVTVNKLAAFIFPASKVLDA